MNADLFLQQFGHLAQGEGGIKKLRHVILQLAVRGKLVEQNPADEPAEVLLKSIFKKKEAILGKSKIKSLHRALANETTHDLPSSWVHTTLDELGVINPRNDCGADTAAGFVPMTLVSEGYGIFPRYEERNWSEISKGYTHFANNDVGLAKITPCFENSKSCVFRDLPNGIGAGTTELHIFRDVTKTLVPTYVWIWIKSPEFLLEGERRMTGSAGQKRVPKDYFALKPFPLAPLAEQKRIVAKVDELMTLCDKLEAEQKTQRTLKTQAVQSALHHLTSAECPASFGASLNILERTFGNWFDDLATVKHLRASILQLAVQGKLVPKADKWKSEKLGDRIELISGQHLKPDEYTNHPEGIPYITGPADFGVISPIPTRWTMEERSVALPGDILVTVKGSGIGKTNIVTEEKLAISRQLMAVRVKNDDSSYIHIILKVAADFFQSSQVGIAIPGIGRKDVLGLSAVFPPLAEQKRIVAKVDKLMTLCDQLEAHITHTQTLNTHLMDSLIHRMTAAA